ncbi:MAG TPA: rod shape-determining protein MreC [Anaeromyxobacteraceae bacterium]|nr:rod shape-determining protein MreC [Anaeromyxobacteraceae bacterium]
MFSLLKRFRDLALVAALLLVPLGVYFAHARRPSERSRLDRFFIVLTAPVERGVAFVIGGALDGWRGYVGLRGAHERAQQLSRRVNELELEQRDKVRLEAENERLRVLLGFAESEPGFEVVGARVIGVRLDAKGLQLVRIDRGADDGVEKLMPVVVARGVVGRVHAVTSSTADVLLLTDLNSSIAVRVARSRARANVRGTGDPDVCRLDYALRSDDLQDADELVTSGTDGIFPRGLAVGRVENLKKAGQGLYQKADVIPAVDVTKLEEVLVLRSRAAGGRDESAAVAQSGPAVERSAPARPPAGSAAAPAAASATPSGSHAATNGATAPNPRAVTSAPHPAATPSPRATTSAPHDTRTAAQPRREAGSRVP